ncbi:MAG TPA: TetR/AcrR family transcriptional regulator [Spirochaetota bacterium]|nr:TetR/AcrR family transcriptional regulator [Spirochaetota bacterium]
MTDKEYHHGNLRDELIRNGLILLNKTGPEEFSLRKVAAMCGVSHNAPYRHFPAKEDLIREIVMTAVDDFRTALTSAIDAHPDDPEEQLFAIGMTYIDFFTAHPEYLSLFFSSGAGEKVTVRAGGISYEKAFLFGILAKSYAGFRKAHPGVTEDETAALIRIWSSIHGFTMLTAGGKIEFSGGLDRYAKEFLSGLIRGLR